MEKTNVIIIRGAPGSGKSQTAKALASFFPKGVRLEVDTIRQMVISVNWKNQQEHINMLQVSTGMVNDFIKFGLSPVIVVDTFSGDKIKQYIDRLLQLNGNFSIKTFSLFVSEEELKKRLKMRSCDEFRDFDISKKLNDDIQKIRYNGEILIDTTGRIPIDTANEIYERFIIENKVFS